MKYLLLAFFAFPVHAADYTPEAAFAEVCHLSRYSCAGVRAPMVRYSNYVEEEGAYGLYYGTATIWMSPDLVGKPALRYVVMAHEMVHYLQVKVDGKTYPQDQFEKCVAEQEAFEISDIIAARLGELEMIRPGILTTAYGC